MRLPTVGEMRRRVAIYNVAFSSSGASALSEKRVLMLEAWAKHGGCVIFCGRLVQG